MLLALLFFFLLCLSSLPFLMGQYSQDSCTYLTWQLSSRRKGGNGQKQHHFHHILLVKASYMSAHIPGELREIAPLDGRSDTWVQEGKELMVAVWRLLAEVTYWCKLNRRDSFRKIDSFICSSKVDCCNEGYETFLDGLFHRDDFINPIMLIRTPSPLHFLLNLSMLN